jgi:hypothetical protein
VKTRQAHFAAAARFRTTEKPQLMERLWPPMDSARYKVDFELNIPELEGGGEIAAVSLDSVSGLVLATKQRGAMGGQGLGYPQARKPRRIAPRDLGSGFRAGCQGDC